MVEKNEQFGDIPEDGGKKEHALDAVSFPVVVGNLYEELQTVIHGYGMDSIETTTKAREVRKKVLNYWSPRLQKVQIHPVHIILHAPPEYTALTSIVTDTETTTCRMSFHKDGERIVNPRLFIASAFHPDGFAIDGASTIFMLDITSTRFSISHSVYEKGEEGVKTYKEKDGYEFEFR